MWFSCGESVAFFPYKFLICLTRVDLPDSPRQNNWAHSLARAKISFTCPKKQQLHLIRRNLMICTHLFTDVLVPLPRRSIVWCSVALTHCDEESMNQWIAFCLVFHSNKNLKILQTQSFSYLFNKQACTTLHRQNTNTRPPLLHCAFQFLYLPRTTPDLQVETFASPSITE